MALEGLQIAQQGARDIANVREKRRAQEVVEAKYRDDKAEHLRVREAQEAIGAAFGETIEGKTELGQVQSLGLSSGLLETAAALDPWMKMSKEQKTFWLVNEAERTKDPVMREAANKAMKTMNRVNYAESYSEALGRLAAEQIYKDKNAKADKSKYTDVQLDNSAMMNSLNKAYPNGKMILTPENTPGLSTTVEIDLNSKDGVYKQLEGLAEKPGPVGSFFGKTPDINENDISIAYKAAQASIYQTLGEKVLPEANGVYGNPLAAGYRAREAQVIGNRLLHGGYQGTFYEPEALDASGRTTQGKFKPFSTVQDFDVGLFGVQSEMGVPNVSVTQAFTDSGKSAIADFEKYIKNHAKVTGEALDTFNTKQTGE